jgi:hypothetical protein
MTSYLNIDYLNRIIEDFGVEVTVLDKVNNFRKYLIAMPLIIADGTDTDGRQLPGVVIVHFRDGDIEPAADPADDGLDDLPLALQGHVLGDAQADSGHADIHWF